MNARAAVGRLEGKVALITGAASGFGASAARRFVAEGARVVLGDVQDDAGAALAEGLGGPDVAAFARCDVAREEDVSALVDLATSRFGGLDVLINNAGVIGAVGPLATTPADAWRRTFDVHVHGTFHGCKHAARVMVPAKSGSIVNVSSNAGKMAGICPHGYTAAKHAVEGITRSAAFEMATHGVRVNAVAPGAMATPMVADVIGIYAEDHAELEGTRKTLGSMSPLNGRAGLPEDVVNAMLFLASDESGYITGESLTIDAGITIGSANNFVFDLQQNSYMGEAGKRGL